MMPCPYARRREVFLLWAIQRTSYDANFHDQLPITHYPLPSTRKKTPDSKVRRF